MDIFEAYLAARDREPTFPTTSLPVGERLEKFDRWLRHQLAQRIDWTWAGDEVAQGRRREQARNYVERMVLALWRRGWLLDGAELAKHIITPLSFIAVYQKKGLIKEFWPYFCATFDRYVGVNSEEIQVEAKRIGATMQQIMGTLAKIAPTSPSLTELISRRSDELTASSLRGQQSTARKRLDRDDSGDRQPELFKMP